MIPLQNIRIGRNRKPANPTSQKNARIFIRNADFQRVMGNYLGNLLAPRGYDRLRLSVGCDGRGTSINVFAATVWRPFKERLPDIGIRYEKLILQLYVENAHIHIPFQKMHNGKFTFRSFVECMSYMRDLINNGRDVPFAPKWWECYRRRPALAQDQDILIPLEL